MLVDTIIDNIKLKGGFPTDNYFTDPQMLSVLNDEMKMKILPLVMRLHEEFLLQTKDYTITDGGTYRLPKRSVGNKIRDIKLYENDSYTDLFRLFEEDRSSNRSGYYITRNTIELSDDIISGTLRVTYFLSPNELVLEASCAEIASIDSATQVTVAALPSTIIQDSDVDFVQANAPNDLLAFESNVNSISGTILTFTSLPDDLAVGDYICVAGQSPVPLVPEELHPVLTQAALVTCLSSKKDKSAEFESKKLEEMIESMINMLDSRSESNDVVIPGQGLLSYIRARR